MAVTFREADTDSYEVLDGDESMIAGIDKMEEDGVVSWVVCFGPGLMRERHFSTLDSAKRWVQRNEGDVADGEDI